MFAVGLSDTAAKKQARALARERAAFVRRNARRRLAELRDHLKGARVRRAAAMRRAVALCRRGRLEVKRKVKAFRAAERERINREVALMRGRAREICSARKARVRASGGLLVERRRAELVEERRLQAQLQRFDSRKRRSVARLVSARERREEDDDAVRSNLPAELVGVFERVKRQIKAGPRRTRTEAFLEWAQEHPEDVLGCRFDCFW